MSTNIFLTGCSFLDPRHWTFIDKDKNFKHKKIQHFSGGGNNVIVTNLIQQVVKNHYDFVFISFSGFDRDDFTIDPECEIPFDCHVHTRDTMGNMHIHSGGFGGSYTLEDENNIFKPRYKTGFNDIHQIEKNCNLIFLAQSVLKYLNVPYIFCFYSNQLEVKNFTTNDSFDGNGISKREYISIDEYKKYVSCLELIDWGKFWFYENEYSKFCGLEEYAYDLASGYLQSDGHHPSEKANYKFWYEEIIPLFNKLYSRK